MYFSTAALRTTTLRKKDIYQNNLKSPKLNDKKRNNIIVTINVTMKDIKLSLKIMYYTLHNVPQHNNVTLSITSLCKMTLSIMTISIATVSAAIKM